MTIRTLRLLTRLGAARAVVLALVVFAGAGVFLPGRAEAATTKIAVGNPNWYCDMSYSGASCPTTVAVGDTVTWNFPSGVYHTTTECRGSTCDDATPPNGSPLWDSGLRLGGSYSYVFTQPGVYYYMCNFHGYSLMRGEITVAAAVGGVAELPQVEFSPVDAAAGAGGPSGGTTLLAGGAAAVLGAIVSIAWYAGRRRVSQLD
jgi:plastocyanin